MMRLHQENCDYRKTVFSFSLQTAVRFSLLATECDSDVGNFYAVHDKTNVGEIWFFSTTIILSEIS